MIRMAQRSPTSPISKVDAEALTKRIRSAVDSLGALVEQAHDRQAWKVMGYATWEAYVSAEFGFTRQRSYQLLDQGRTAKALGEAGGILSTAVDISERAARDIKADLPEVVEEIRTRVEQGEDPKTAVAETIDAKRVEKEQARETRKAEQAEHDRQRDEARAALPDAIKQLDQAKADAIAARNATPADIDARDAELEELREANAALETELAEVKADSAKWDGMRVQFEQGGFEKVIAGKDEEIHALQTRLYRESEDKASWMRSAKYWQAEAKKLGFSSDVVIDIETGEVVDG